MNKPVAKEPSMDEILSSIRQIIAEDDAISRKGPAGSSAFSVQLPEEPAVSSFSIVPPADPLPEVPLALSPEQVVQEELPEPPPIADPDLAQFERELTGGPEPDGPPAEADEDPDAEMVGLGYAEAELVEADDINFDDEGQQGPEMAAPHELEPISPPSLPVRPAMPMGKAAPMPDPSLSSDLAEQLLEPATNAAVRHTFSRLGNVAVGTPQLTLESMMREMLRPMLKDWLDENLPAVVERMVEREIARISRGVE